MRNGVLRSKINPIEITESGVSENRKRQNLEIMAKNVRMEKKSMNIQFEELQILN